MSHLMTLSNRASLFQKVILSCEISDKSGNLIALETGLDQCFTKLVSAGKFRRRIAIVGNGGSAAVAAHATTDFFNVAKLNATTLHESSLLTCMANDFGYENAFARMVKQTLTEDDMLIAISSSGNSKNIRNAAQVASEIGCQVVTLSGFSNNNPLRSIGEFNIWLDSRDYGFVEVGHQFVLHNLADRIRTAQEA